MDREEEDIIEYYALREKEIEPTQALRILCRLYIENCGVSLGNRTVAENAMYFWKKRWKQENPNLRKAISLDEVLSAHSEEYKQNKAYIDKFDVTILNDEELVTISNSIIEEISDERSRIAICAGVKYILDLGRDTKH